MRKCPHCQADIQENARFCLYCMQPLVQKQTVAPKKKRSIWWLIPVVALILLVSLAILWLVQDAPVTPSAAVSVPESSVGDTTGQETEGSAPQITPADPTQGPTQPTTPVAATPSESKPAETTPTSPTTQPTGEPTTAPTTEVTEPTPVIDYGNGIPGTTGYRTQTSIQHYNTACDDDFPFYGPGADAFLYSPCTASDVPHSSLVRGYVASGGCGNVRCGIYTISDTPFGQPVVAIRCGINDDIVKLTVPETVIAIGSRAFEECFEFKYLCIKGEQMDIALDAFPPMESRWYQIVICCSATCKNYKGEYIKDIVGRYGAVWEEWNG